MNAQLSSSPTFPAFAGGGLPNQPGILEELERLKREHADLKTEFKKMEDGYGSLLKRNLLAEHALLETQTALAVAARQAQERQSDFHETERALKRQLDELQSLHSSPSSTMVSVLLTLEKQISSLLLEVVHQLSQCGDAPNLTVEIVNTIRSTNVVPAFAQLRLWVRRLLELHHDGSVAAHRRTQRLQSMRALGDSIMMHQEQEKRSSMLWSSVLTRRLEIAGDPNRGKDGPETETLRKQVASLKAEIQSMQKFVQEAEETSRVARRAAEVSIATANKETAEMRQALRKAKRDILALQEAAQFTVDRSLLAAAEEKTAQLSHDLHDANNSAVAALRSREAAFQAKELAYQKQIAALQRRLTGLESQAMEARELQDAMIKSKAEAVDAKKQLLRAGVKGLQDRAKAQSAKLQEVQQENDQLHSELDRAKLSIASIQHTNEKMVRQYNVIFEAHLQSQQQQARLAAQRQHNASAAATIGPNSQLDAQYYRTRYAEALHELKKAQKKLKHLIFLSHHDHLSFGLQREDLARQLREARSYVPATSETMSSRAASPTTGFAPSFEDHTNPNASGLNRTLNSSGGPDDGPIEHFFEDTAMLSFATYVERQKRTPRAGRSPSRSGARVASHSPDEGYDRISSHEVIHDTKMALIGRPHSAQSVSSFSNPTEVAVTAKIRLSQKTTDNKGASTAAAHGGGVGEVSTRVAIKPKLEELTKMVEGQGGVEFEEDDCPAVGMPTASIVDVRKLVLSKKNRPAAYMQKSRLEGGVAKLSRPMTPASRPGSALL